VRSSPGSLRFDPAREQEELREYLGGAYDQALLERYQDTLESEFAGCGDEWRFYRESRAYLYNLTAFAMTGTKLPYLEALMRRAPAPARLLDYGCGIGSDGLMLLESGYRVEFADFDNPSAEYLRWRLARRGLDAPVHDLDGEVPGGFDAAYAFDVIEHVPDPFAFLGELERRAALVAVNLLEPGADEQELHHDLPVRALLRRAVRRGLVHYRVVQDRSHLVLYRAGIPRGVRPIGEARLAGGRLRRALGRRAG